MMKRMHVLAMLALVLPCGAWAAALDDTAKLPLDKLLDTPVSTAAKYDQQLSNVAASVTVITAEEIQRYGWTSLAEALQAVRGFYLTYDRDYAYIGTRGIGRPTDYNNRLLIMVDGHPVTEPVVGSQVAGNDLAIDMSAVEKIEIIRGPGSAVYGTHAMLAVINVFLKDANALDGTSVTALAGSQGTRGMSLRLGQHLAYGWQITATGLWQESSGANLYFPEYDTPQTNHGVAQRLDYEDFHRYALTLRRGGFRFALSSRSRTKGVPTGMYDTVFNTDEQMTKAQDVAVVEYHRALDGNKSIELRGYWDHSHYHGHYQYDELGVDRYDADVLGGEARGQWDLSPNQRFTAGTEYQDLRHIDYLYTVGDYKIALTQPSTMTSYYLQYEGHPSPRLGLLAGIRRDDFYATADSTNPRAALLFTPNRSTSVKLLYGSAFRSPNVYEAYYNDPLTPWKAHPDLKPETIRTTELVLERRISPTTLFTASAYHINAGRLIDEQLEPESQAYWYDNVGEMESNGVEMAVHMRRPDGIWSRFSISAQDTKSDGQPADNSPRYAVKGGLSTSPWAPWHGGIEGVFEAGRRTRDGERTDAYLLLNGIVSHQLTDRLRLSLSSRNLLNTHYAHPVGPELRQQSIRQDGRTFTFKLTYTR
jgi:iron complex outermembrane receptor protein